MPLSPPFAALAAFAVTLSLVACGPSQGDPNASGPDASELDASIPDLATSPPPPIRLGAHLDATGTTLGVQVRSTHATRIEACFYAKPVGTDASSCVPLVLDPLTNIFFVEVPRGQLTAAGIGDTIYYGLRAWGPNWPYHADWKPGSSIGFLADVDADGNRQNPNKLLIDPYALELSHDPLEPDFTDGTLYASGAANRARDSGPHAPKGIVLEAAVESTSATNAVTRPFKDDVIYEVHLRGFTMADPSINDCQGTYRAAGAKAAYLKSLGITAIELLPIMESQNDDNGTRGAGHDNYWGYATLNWFAPDRRYACDRSPGGPTREFIAMASALHDAGIKLLLDIVYNHTGEGGLWNNAADVATVLSYRGLDNAVYYEPAADKRFYQDNTGCCGPNVAAANSLAGDLIIDSLQHWRRLGADGFRFDLAPIVGNSCRVGCFNFDSGKSGLLSRIASTLPARPNGGGDGADLIAEPWAVGNGTYQLGHFPLGWADWNGQFRDLVRQIQNHPPMNGVTMGWLADRVTASSELFRKAGRKPWSSINYITSHDGLCLRDLYAYNKPAGENAWDQNGDPLAQRQAARTGLSLALLSDGVPMMGGGDELYRTQLGNPNGYNIDSAASWLDWTNLKTYSSFHDFARRLLAFRAAHPALRPADWWNGNDPDGNGLKDITFYEPNAGEADGLYLDDSNNRFLGWRIDGAGTGDTAASIYVAYNAGDRMTISLPVNLPTRSWYRAGNTDGYFEPQGNFTDAGQELKLTSSSYDLSGHAVVVLIER